MRSSRSSEVSAYCTRRCDPEPVPIACVRRQQFPAFLEHHRPQHAPLRQRQSLPRRFEQRVLLGQQPAQRLVKILERRPPPAAHPHLVPRFVRQTLDVIWQVPGEVDDGGAQTRLRLDARSLKMAVDEGCEFLGRDALEANDRSGLVERPPRAEHPLHQAGLRAGEHVSDRSLMLHGGAQGMLDRPAVEAADRLKLVEGDDHRPASRVGEPRGKGEDLLRETRDVAIRSDAWKGDADRAERAGGHAVADLGARRTDHLAQPGPRAIALRLGGAGGHDGPGVALEEGDVGAEAADRHLDRQRAALRHGGERVADQRRLAVSARRDQEDLLAGGEIGDQPIQLDDAVREGRRGHDLAVDEGILHYGSSYNGYMIRRNGGSWESKDLRM